MRDIRSLLRQLPQQMPGDLRAELRRRAAARHRARSTWFGLAARNLIEANTTPATTACSCSTRTPPGSTYAAT
ncbi:hypothetical protein [Dactylosporangium sp. NPDC049140]|uniref:hypothetical protein n=1 Tax=Dactylosporangium sp. NPDC049140 TaxID=3155647 RepID=UPI0033C5E2EF